MARQKYKTIQRENGTIDIYGDSQDIELHYAIPDWSEDNEELPAFMYHGDEYFLDEFMPIYKYSPEWMHEFDGYSNDTYFSGMLIKLSDNSDGIKVYDYCC